MNNKLFIFIIFLFFIGGIIAQEAQSGNVNESGKFPSNFDKSKISNFPTQATLTNLESYLKGINGIESRTSPGGEKVVATVKISQNGLIRVEFKVNGETKVLQIPPGVNLIKSQNGWEISGQAKPNPALNPSDPDIPDYAYGPEDNPIENSMFDNIVLEDIILRPTIKPMKASINTKDGNKVLKIESEIAGFQIGKYYNDGIKNGEIHIDKDNRIIFVDITATSKGGIFIFPTLDGKNLFRTTLNGNGRLLYDPLKKILHIENAKGFQYATQENPTSYQIDAEAKILDFSFDDNGKIIDAKVEVGYIDISGVGNFHTKNGPINIFFGKKDITDIKNAVVIDSGKVIMKGDIKAEGLIGKAGSYYYESLSEKNEKGVETITEFDTEKSIFDVKSGSAKFHNNKHEVEVINGEAKLRLRENVQDSGSFGFKTINKDGLITEGFLNYKNGEDSYNLIIYKEGGDKIVVSVPLSLISANPVSSNEVILLDLDTKKQLLAVQIQNLKNQLGELTGASKEKVELDILQKENELSILNGENLDGLIKRTNEFITSIGDKKTQQEARLVLSKLINEKTSLKEVPKSFRVNTKFLIDSGDLSIRGYETGVQPIDFDVNRDGQVVAYYFNGKRYEVIPGKTELAPGLEQKNINLIQSLNSQAGASFESIQHLVTSEEIVDRGYSYSSPQFKEAFGIVEESRNNLLDVMRYAQANKDNDLYNRANMLYAESFISSKQYKVAEDMLYKIGNDNKIPSSLRSRADMLSAIILSESGKPEDNFAVMKILYDSIEKDPNNAEAIRLREALNRKHLMVYAAVAHLESAATMDDTDKMLGAGHGAARTSKDILSIIFQPGTNIDLVLRKNNELMGQQGRNFDMGNMRWMSAYTLGRLQDSGVSVREYASGTMREKFEHVYRTNHYDEYLSVEKLNGYLQEAGLDPGSIGKVSTSEMAGRFETFRQLVEEKEGGDIARTLDTNILKTFTLMAGIEDSLQNSKTLFEMARNGVGDIPGLTYTGDEMAKAFNEQRVGQEIKYSDSETLVLTAMDTLLNPLTYLGIGAAAKAGQALKFAAKEVISETLTDVGLQLAANAQPQVGALLRIANFGKNFVRPSKGTMDISIHQVEHNGVKYAFAQIDDTDVEGFVKGIKGATLDKTNNLIKLEDGTIMKYGSKLPTGATQIDTTAIVNANHAEVQAGQQQVDNTFTSASGAERKVDTTSGCFLADTKIMMADKSYKNIQDILIGERVVAFDIENNKFTETEVTTTFVRKENRYRIIEYEIIE